MPLSSQPSTRFSSEGGVFCPIPQRYTSGSRAQGRAGWGGRYGSKRMHLPQEDTHMPEQVEAVVIGGGQAGLAISYYLTQQGRPHVVLEQATQVAPAWRHGRWDSFTLVTPNWSVRLTGFPYQGDDPDGFMPRADMVYHLEQYAASFQAPVRCGVQVTAVDPARDEQGYRVTTANGVTYAAATVVVATGSFQFPKPSPFTGTLPHEILQL